MLPGARMSRVYLEEAVAKRGEVVLSSNVLPSTASEWASACFTLT